MAPCEECGEKKARLSQVLKKPLCVDCKELDKYKVIVKTAAKSKYMLKDNELSHFDSYKANCRYGEGTFYLENEIREYCAYKYEIEPENLDNYLQDIKNEKNFKLAKQKQSREMKARVLQELRKSELLTGLTNAGLKFRADSVLCSNYINGISEMTVKEIVDQMCKMKYLFEYCKMDECKAQVYNKFIQNREFPEYYPGFVFDLAEQFALEKYSNSSYPLVYPWFISKKICFICKSPHNQTNFLNCEGTLQNLCYKYLCHENIYPIKT